MSVADKMADQFVPEVDPNPAEPRMVIWSTLRCLELQIDQHEELYDSHGVVSWELLKHMVRLAKRHAHEEGGKAEAAERETDQWRTRADEANAKLREAEQELQRLRRFVGGVEGALGAFQSISPDTCCDQIARCLSELEDSPAPVAEPPPCPECERLHKFVGAVRLAMWPEDLRSALKTLDACNEPTPVAEPLDAEGGK